MVIGDVHVDDRHREFDRDQALLEAARLFWRSGYSGTSTRALTSAIGISSSSLYSAFGSKAGLFAEAVRVYADRYGEIYRSAVAADSIGEVVGGLLRASVIEFTQDPATRPGCMVTSAIITDSSETIEAAALTDAVQALWHGLSAQSNQGLGRDRLLAAAAIAADALTQVYTVTD